MISIRPATSNDIPAIVQSIYHASDSPPTALPLPEAIWRDVDPLVRVREQLLRGVRNATNWLTTERYQVRVAVKDDGGDVVGFAVWDVDPVPALAPAPSDGETTPKKAPAEEIQVPGMDVELETEADFKSKAVRREFKQRHRQYACESQLLFAAVLCAATAISLQRNDFTERKNWSLNTPEFLCCLPAGLSWLIVSPETQRSGVGSALLKDGKALFSDRPILLTSVSSELSHLSSNRNLACGRPKTLSLTSFCSRLSAAIDYYPKHGFRFYGPRPEFKEGQIFVS